MRKCPKADPHDYDFECPFYEEGKPCNINIERYKNCILFCLDYIIEKLIPAFAKLGLDIEK